MQAYFYTDLDDGVVTPAYRCFETSPNALLSTGPKLCAYVSPSPTMAELRFVKQMGVSHVFTWFQLWQDVSLDRLKGFVTVVEQAELMVYNVGCLEIAKSTDIILRTAKAEEHIAYFQTFIGWLKAAGISTTTFTWEATG